MHWVGAGVLVRIPEPDRSASQYRTVISPRPSTGPVPLCIPVLVTRSSTALVLSQCWYVSNTGTHPNSGTHLSTAPVPPQCRYMSQYWYTSQYWYALQQWTGTVSVPLVIPVLNWHQLSVGMHPSTGTVSIRVCTSACTHPSAGLYTGQDWSASKYWNALIHIPVLDQCQYTSQYCTDIGTRPSAGPTGPALGRAGDVPP